MMAESGGLWEKALETLRDLRNDLGEDDPIAMKLNSALVILQTLLGYIPQPNERHWAIAAIERAKRSDKSVAINGAPFKILKFVETTYRPFNDNQNRYNAWNLIIDRDEWDDPPF